MVINAEALKSTVKNEAVGLIFKNKSDPRITRIGQFLRKTVTIPSELSDTPRI